jgi:hypothetical protein
VSHLECGPEKYALPRAEFVELMKQSDATVGIVASWLLKNGFEVDVPELRISPSWQERLKYADDGDLFFWKKEDDKKRMEVKHWPNIGFTSVEDVRYPNVIVNAVNSWDQADPKPDFHFILDSSKTHVLSINSNTQDHWFKTTKFDRRKGGNRAFYFCPKQYVKCIKIRG